MEIEKMDFNFNKEKDGIFRKAHKINALCDAEVSIIMLCNNNELYEYTTPTSTMKKIIDQYQSTVGVDLWSSHYEKMQEELGILKEVNSAVKREIMQRKGEELDNLNMVELCTLEEEMISTLQHIRCRKHRMIMSQMDIRKKNVKWLQETHETLLDLEMEYVHRGEVVDEGLNSTAAFAGRVYDNHVPVQQPRRLLRDEDENSCVTTVSMEVEDSV